MKLKTHQRHDGGNNHFWASSDCWQNPAPWRCRTEGLNFLMEVASATRCTWCFFLCERFPNATTCFLQVIKRERERAKLFAWWRLVKYNHRNDISPPLSFCWSEANHRSHPHSRAWHSNGCEERGTTEVILESITWWKKQPINLWLITSRAMSLSRYSPEEAGRQTLRQATGTSVKLLTGSETRSEMARVLSQGRNLEY